MAKTITITALNRSEGGFAEKFTLEKGTTIGQFVYDQDIDPDDFVIRISRKKTLFTPTSDEVLEDGDRVSIVPLKIDGAV